MHDEQLPTWQERLAKLRAGKTQLCAAHELQTSLNCDLRSTDISSEALMTIIAIMKDNDDPKVQMAAAKMLLEQKKSAPIMTAHPEHNLPTADDVDAAIALAKSVLDELALIKTQKLDGASEVVAGSAPGTDNPAR